MNMTDIEQKALELDLIARVIAAYHTTRMIEDAHKHCHASPHVREAIDRLIASVAEADKSRHAAELREQAERFSEAAGKVVEQFGSYGYNKLNVSNLLSPFILAPVDPLVEALEIALWNVSNVKLTAGELAEIAAIVKKEAVNG